MTLMSGHVRSAFALSVCVVAVTAACSGGSQQPTTVAKQFESDVAAHGVSASRLTGTYEGGQTLGDAVCANVKKGQAPGNVAIGLNNLEGSNRFTMAEALVVTYWAIKDICPDQIGNGVKEGWKDDVNNPPRTDSAEPPYIGAPSAAAAPTPAAVPCEAQQWPQAVPGDLVGKTFTDVVEFGPLQCFDIGSATTPDGRDLYNGGADANEGQRWVLASVSPPTGTLIGKNQPINITLVAKG